MFDEQNVQVVCQYFILSTDVVDLLMAVTLVICSLTLFISNFEGAFVGLDMSGFLAIIVDSIISRLALASLICRRWGRTSPSTVRLVGQTLYYVVVTG